MSASQKLTAETAAAKAAAGVRPANTFNSVGTFNAAEGVQQTPLPAKKPLPPALAKALGQSSQ
ncbi:hypothetical protein IVB11_29905 [Bradyrhizobium sp. 177]|uniref:hypothetical protein n=1 Tax=Bradyrhizobium sp. 177 TaxID=2782647 RepID=UPI001FFBF486|nr:hypothetical protein [Bradyrhizobium sp. 177]MCK1553141.1 hypothetical protein [Bradyrhizobium sp. 177]